MFLRSFESTVQIISKQTKIFQLKDSLNILELIPTLPCLPQAGLKREGLIKYYDLTLICRGGMLEHYHLLFF